MHPRRLRWPGCSIPERVQQSDFWWVAVWDPLALCDEQARKLEQFIADWPAPWNTLIIRDRTGIADRERLSGIIQQTSPDRIWINRDITLATELGCVGITLGSDDDALARQAARQGLPWICAVHGATDLDAAPARGAAALLFGHVRDTPSKPGTAGRGVDALADVCARSQVPVIAIGGLSPADGDLVRAHGAGGLAAIRAAFA